MLNTSVRSNDFLPATNGCEWQEIRLGDIVSIMHGWPFVGELCSEELSGKPIVVSIGNFRYTGGFRFEETMVREYRGDYPREYELTRDEILLIMTCQTPGGEILGVPARVPDDGRTYLHNQRMGKVVVKQPELVDEDYLYWLFLWPEFNRELFLSATGAKILHTAPTRIEAFRFRCPPLSEQRVIASVLGALDDKIELNRRMNETLEALAQSIFKSWFVDFDPARNNGGTRRHSEIGPVPKEWHVDRLDKHITADRGLSYNGEGLPMHNLNSVYEGGGYKHEGIKYYAGEYREKHLLSPGDMIVTNTEQGFDHLLIGHAAIIPERYGPKGLFSHHIYRIRFKSSSPLTPHYLVHLFNTPRWHYWISGFSNGTTINMLPMDALQMPLVVVPPGDMVQKFTSLAAAIHSKVEANLEESRTLAALRDALLPKLLSGELRVPNAEISEACV
jgi:type I restriction enzyme S subunit